MASETRRQNGPVAQTTVTMAEESAVREVDGVALQVSGWLPRICRVRDEYFEFVEQPSAFAAHLRRSRPVPADVFTFIQEIDSPVPEHGPPQAWEPVTVLPLTSYDAWWSVQLNNKT